MGHPVVVMIEPLFTAGDNYQSLHTNDASAPSRDLVAPLVSLSVAAAVIVLFGTCKFTMPALQVGGRPLELLMLKV